MSDTSASSTWHFLTREYPHPAAIAAGLSLVRERWGRESLLSRELALEGFVDHLRISTSAHLLHYHTDEKSEQLVASAAILRDLGGLRSQDLVAGCRDRRVVRHLREPERGDGRLCALAGLAHRGERGLRGIEAYLLLLYHLKQRPGLIRL